MTADHQLTEAATSARRRWQSVGAAALGLVVALVLTRGTDPVLHAVALRFVRLVLDSAGAAGAMMKKLGPNWYPIAIVVAALPCAWLGESLHRVMRGQE
jgi:hypothetical protein